MKTLTIEQLTSFLRKAKESGVFEMHSGNLLLTENTIQILKK
ncbi:hypothetical protein [uncultured Oscillibacter sp.]|nr:hypothetical protein [uncultured Oscillibacter sp.]